jgi:putative MATE family efflux protein
MLIGGAPLDGHSFSVSVFISTYQNNKIAFLNFSAIQSLSEKDHNNYMQKSTEFGTAPINKLLLKQAVPASIGILVMSIYGIVDTIFVGNYIGSLGIAAITVVIPITFLISSVGMGIGIGGASIISRSLGADDYLKARKAFGNQVGLTLSLGVLFCFIGYIFIEPILAAFGAKGNILAPTIAYFQIILLGIPFLAFAMMSNNVIRALGYPRTAMVVMIVPAIINMIFDPIFIVWLDFGIEGAAWATTISYIMSASYCAFFLFFGKSKLKIDLKYFLPDPALVKEIFSIGGVTFARQGIVSLLFLVLNNSLFKYGGEMSIAIYGIINRVMMVVNFPALGITQGFLPILGYNFGAKKWSRVKKVIKNAMLSGTTISFVIFSGIMLFTETIIGIFTNDASLIQDTTPALRTVFIATPLIALQLLSSAYYQAIGKAIPALFLTLTKQGFFLIPLILILPNFWGINGIWMAFPIADVSSAIICVSYLIYDNKRVLLSEKASLQSQEA